MTSNTQGKEPLSRHPLFPGVVALWFAVLLGVGSLVIGTGSMENAVLALHIDAVLPAAAPPLGFTARLLFALACAMGGAIIGFVVARRIARSAAVGRPADYTESATASPHSASSDALDQGEDLARLDAAREGLPLRRRALTSAQDDTMPTDPGDSLGTLPLTRRIAPAILSVSELGEAVEEPGGIEPPQAPATKTEQQPSAPPLAGPELSAAPETVRESQLDQLSLSELVARFAEAVAARRPNTVSVAPAHLPAAEDGSDPRFSPVGQGSPASAIPQRPFDMPASMREPGVGDIEWFDEEQEEATLESLLPPRQSRPDDPCAAAMPHLAGMDRGTLPEDEAGAEALDDVVADGDTYSSLLDMRSARQAVPVPPFVRIDDAGDGAEVSPEPIVSFPGQAVPASPARLSGNGAAPAAMSAGTDDALRDALAALQRMSGAA